MRFDAELMEIVDPARVDVDAAEVAARFQTLYRERFARTLAKRRALAAGRDHVRLPMALGDEVSADRDA
jgi:hypothetical protein